HRFHHRARHGRQDLACHRAPRNQGPAAHARDGVLMDASIKRVAQLDATGTGAGVVLLQADAAPSHVASLLAQHFRTVRYTVDDAKGAHSGAASGEVAAAIASQGNDPIGLIADTATASVALALVTTRPELVRALALLAPRLPDGAIPELKTPVLALFGT